MAPVIRAAQTADVAALVQLWERCGLTRPWNPPEADIARARARENSDILVALLAERVVASVMVGHDGHRGWVYYVAADPDCRGQGLGRTMMAAAEAWLTARGIRKLELMVREGNAAAQGFYEQIGYAREPVMVMARWLDGTERP